MNVYKQKNYKLLFMNTTQQSGSSGKHLFREIVIFLGGNEHMAFHLYRHHLKLGSVTMPTVLFMRTQ